MDRGHQDGDTMAENPRLKLELVMTMAAVILEISCENIAVLLLIRAVIFGLAAVGWTGQETVTPAVGLADHWRRACTVAAPHLVTPVSTIIVTTQGLDTVQHGTNFATAIGSVPAAVDTPTLAVRRGIASTIAARNRGGRDRGVDGGGDVDGHIRRHR